MEAIVLIALIVVCVRLWLRTSALEARLGALEIGGVAPRIWEPQPETRPSIPEIPWAAHAGA